MPSGEGVAPEVFKHHVELDPLERDEFFLINVAPEPGLLALPYEHVGVPIHLPAHERRDVGGTGVHFAEEPELSRAAEPVPGVFKIPFPAMDHAVPIAAQAGRDLLDDAMALVDRIVGVEEPGPDELWIGDIGEHRATGEFGLIGVANAEDGLRAAGLRGAQAEEKVFFGQKFLDEGRIAFHTRDSRRRSSRVRMDRSGT